MLFKSFVGFILLLILLLLLLLRLLQKLLLLQKREAELRVIMWGLLFCRKCNKIFALKGFFSIAIEILARSLIESHC